MTEPGNSGPAAALLEAAVIACRPLAPGTVQLDLVRPPGFAFAAGQRIRIHHGAAARDYSLASATDAPFLSLCARVVRQGTLSPTLGNARAGDRFFFTGPYGYFVFRSSARHPVLVATGTGIAPFSAMCRSGLSGFTLLHGVRRPEQRYYAELFRSAADRYVACLGLPRRSDKDWFAGRVTDYLAKQLPAGEYDFYLCGRGEMVRDATRIIDERFSGARVYTEIFF